MPFFTHCCTSQYKLIIFTVFDGQYKRFWLILLEILPSNVDICFKPFAFMAIENWKIWWISSKLLRILLLYLEPKESSTLHIDYLRHFHKSATSSSFFLRSERHHSFLYSILLILRPNKSAWNSRIALFWKIFSSKRSDLSIWGKVSHINGDTFRNSKLWTSFCSMIFPIGPVKDRGPPSNFEKRCRKGNSFKCKRQTAHWIACPTCS